MSHEEARHKAAVRRAVAGALAVAALGIGERSEAFGQLWTMTAIETVAVIGGGWIVSNEARKWRRDPGPPPALPYTGPGTMPMPGYQPVVYVPMPAHAAMPAHPQQAAVVMQPSAPAPVRASAGGFVPVAMQPSAPARAAVEVPPQLDPDGNPWCYRLRAEATARTSPIRSAARDGPDPSLGASASAARRGVRRAWTAWRGRRPCANEARRAAAPASGAAGRAGAGTG